MQHGRGHDERSQKARPPRSSNTPPEAEDEIEAELVASGGKGIRPRERVIGAHTERGFDSTYAPGEDEGQEPTGPGSDVAPTKKAEERERERHRLERERGRAPSAEDGQIRDHRAPGVTREDLDEAARLADEHVKK